MTVATVCAWLVLALLLGSLCAAPGGLKRYRWPAAAAVGAALLACLGLVWATSPAVFTPWQGGLDFDSLAQLILPPLWTGAAAIILACLFLPDARYELAFAAGSVGLATAGIMSGSPLLTITLLEACALLTLAGVVVRAERPAANSLLSIATALKYVTLTVVSAACLVMALLLANFYAVNQDRAELPRIVVEVLLIGFGLATGMMPFYFYLPDLLDAAPLVTSASFIGPLQCLAFVYLVRSAGNGPWLLADQHVVNVLVYGGLSGAVLAVVLSFGQRNVHRVLAFNVMREAGWLAFGLGSVTRAGWSGALLFLAIRCITQPLLLAALAVVEQHAGERLPGKMKPAALTLPVTAIAWCVGLLASTGIPPAPNFWAMAGLLRASIPFGWLATAMLLGSGILGLWRMGQITLAVFWNRPFGAPIDLRSLPSVSSEPAPLTLGTATDGVSITNRERPAISWLMGVLVFGVAFGGIVPQLFNGPVNGVLDSLPFLR